MKFIRVDMTVQAIAVTDVPQAYRDLGGRGLTSKLLMDEVNPNCFPLGKCNKFVIAPGLLTGTTAPCSGRTSIGAKSPLTGTIKESNVGGIAGQYLAGHRIKALIVEGEPTDNQCRLLVVDSAELRLEERSDLAGLGNYAVVSQLRKEFGMDCAVISTGPAGEQGATLATVAVCDTEGRPSRHAGRGGMGAVMASKGLKAIVISRPPPRQIQPADPGQFQETVRTFAKVLIEGKKNLTTYGTAVLVNVVNETGGLPTRNFSSGRNEAVDQFSGEKLRQLCEERGGATGHGCHRGCVIRCSNIFHDAKGNYVTAGLEYETIALLGSNCGVHDLDAIARFDRLCDDLGIDTMEMGVAIGVAMEGGMLPFGDVEAMEHLIAAVAGGNPAGKIVGQGATVTGRLLGVERVPAVKGQSLSGYDPRAFKGTGVTYATSTMGADHTTGNCLPGRGGLNSHSPHGQVTLSRDLQAMSMVCDILGLCIFIGPVVESMPFLASLVSAFHGREISVNSLLQQAREILLMESQFNRLAGISRHQNDLPSFFRTEPLPNNGLVFDVPASEMMEVMEMDATLELYRRLVEGIGNEYCIYSTDKDGIWLYLSPSAKKLLGYPTKSLLGKHWHEIWTPEFSAPAAAIEDKMKTGWAPPTYEMHYLHPDGTRRTFQISEKPVLDADGSTVAIEGIMVDITQRLQDQENLRNANDSLELLNQELENRVQERTTELEREIEVRRGAEQDLRHALNELAGLKARLEVENSYLQEEIQRSNGFDEIVGESDVLRKALNRVTTVAATDATVLILGETGTGKELFARAIHTMSRRRDRALVAVNCAALPATIIESELFGHEKGAFTGAFARKLGRFEVANGGTIFLDEIGELPLELQAKLLRALQQGEFERVGSSTTQKVDVRVIAATNRDLKADAKEGKFRADLYYRLSVFPIHVPSLRERRDDIPLLVWHFIRKLQGRWGKSIQQVPPEIIRSLQAYSWPGNVRELENVIERATILSPGPLLMIDEPQESNEVEPEGLTASQNLEDVERTHILQMLESCGWKIAGRGNAADRVGMNASTLRSRMKKLGIRRPGN